MLFVSFKMIQKYYTILLRNYDLTKLQKITLYMYICMLFLPFSWISYIFHRKERKLYEKINIFELFIFVLFNFFKYMVQRDLKILLSKNIFTFFNICAIVWKQTKQRFMMWFLRYVTINIPLNWIKNSLEMLIKTL